MNKLTVRYGPLASKFKEIYNNVLRKYEAGARGADSLVTSEEGSFLASVGHTKQELYDFVEDRAEVGEPSFKMALRITAVRRDYFLKEQHGRPRCRPDFDGCHPSDASDIRWLCLASTDYRQG